MSFSQVLFGQHFHPSAVIIAYLLFDNDDDAHATNNQTHNHKRRLLTSLEAQSRFVSHVLESSSVKRSVKNNKKNLEYTASVAKAYVKWLEEIYNNTSIDHNKDTTSNDVEHHDGDDDEEEDHVLEFDDDLMESSAPSFSSTKMNQEDAEDEDDDGGDDEWKTLTFYTSTSTATSTTKTGSTDNNIPVHDVSRSHQQKMYAKVGPQFVNVGLSLWPASALMSKFVVDEMKKTIMNNSSTDGTNSNTSSSGMTKDETRCNHVYIELGTGIGLTGVYFEKALTLFSSSSSQHRFIMTDYQDIILDLGNTNLKLNRCINNNSNNNNISNNNNNIIINNPSEYRYLHWGELEQNTRFFEKVLQEEQQLKQQQQQLEQREEDDRRTRTKTIYTICAADVIYDPSAIPDLVQTIDIGLNILSSSSSSSSFDEPVIRVIIYHTVRNPKTFELFKELSESKGMNVEMCEIEEESEQDKELNGKLIKLIDTVSASSSSSLLALDDKMITSRIKPFLKFPVQRENILRSLQDGKFYNGIFAKMAPQLRKVIVTRKEITKK